jgi:hypothetical protein
MKNWIKYTTDDGRELILNLDEYSRFGKCDIELQIKAYDGCVLQDTRIIQDGPAIAFMSSLGITLTEPTILI